MKLSHRYDGLFFILDLSENYFEGTLCMWTIPLRSMKTVNIPKMPSIYLFTSVQAWWKIDILVYINEARGVDNMLKNTRWHRVGFMLVGENLEFNFVFAHFELITLLRAAYI